MLNNLYNIISLQSFTVFTEYFIALSIIYILIVITLITYNSDGLMLQKAISECMALILFMSCYLLINEQLQLRDTVKCNGHCISKWWSLSAEC